MIDKPDRHSFSIYLNDREMAALEAIAAEKDVSKSAIVRMGVKLLIAVSKHTAEGQRMYFEDANGKVIEFFGLL